MIVSISLVSRCGFDLSSFKMFDGCLLQSRGFSRRRKKLVVSCQKYGLPREGDAFCNGHAAGLLSASTIIELS